MLPNFDLSAQHGQGSFFVPNKRYVPELPPWGGMSQDDLRSWVSSKWAEAVEGKRAETERLKLCELFYSGFHYKDGWLNRINPVTNYCFSVVETVWPLLTERRPRPEVSPRRSMSAARIEAIAQGATWLMDSTGFDRAFRLGVRDKLKYGWNVHLITFERETGIPYPRNFSVFDYYPDPTATNEGELEYFFIAQPVSTARLRALFPKCAADIKPDGFASPSYDVLVRPYQDAIEAGYRTEHPAVLDHALRFSHENQTPTGGSTPLVMQPGQYIEHGQTTFLLQMFVRDRRNHSVVYRGNLHQADPEDPTRPIVQPWSHKSPEPTAPSGWLVITMTADGTFPEDPAPLDTCWGGVPVVIGRDYEQTGRFYAKGEQDEIIPIQRDLNRRYALLNRSLEISANPPALTTTNSGLRSDLALIEAGDVLRIHPGADVKWLEFRGPSQQQFEMLQIRQRDIDTISGAHDVQQGQRPAGIEAAAAIRRLQEAAAVRVRGKEAGLLEEYTAILKKMMTASARKMLPRFVVKGLGGQDFSIDPSSWDDDFDVRWAQGTGTVAAEEQRQELTFAMYDRGLLDEQAALETLNWKNRDELLMRLQARRAQEAMMAAEASAKSQPPGGSRRAG